MKDQRKGNRLELKIDCRKKVTTLTPRPATDIKAISLAIGKIPCNATWAKLGLAVEPTPPAYPQPSQWFPFLLTPPAIYLSSSDNSWLHAGHPSETQGRLCSCRPTTIL